MVTRDMIERWLREAYLSQYIWLAEYMTAITELMEHEAFLKAEVPKAVQNAIKDIKGCAERPGAAGVRRILVEHIELVAMASCPAEVQRLRAPAPPEGWNPDEPTLEERQMQQLMIREEVVKLGKYRTRGTIEHGQRLVDAAMTLLGKYKWVPSGLDPDRSYFPNERTTDKDTDELTSNDFALWINRHQPLTDASRLNCWEAVFVCATKAGLLSETQLRMHYAVSAVVAVRATLPRTAPQKQKEDLLEGDYLLRVMMQFDRSLPIVPGTALVPDPGDLIFINGDHHVVICSRVDAHRGLQGIDVISHWKHPRHGLLDVPLDSWGERLLRKVRFTPCPF